MQLRSCTACMRGIEAQSRSSNEQAAPGISREPLWVMRDILFCHALSAAWQPVGGKLPCGTYRVTTRRGQSVAWRSAGCIPPCAVSRAATRRVQSALRQPVAGILPCGNPSGSIRPAAFFRKVNGKQVLSCQPHNFIAQSSGLPPRERHPFRRRRSHGPPPPAIPP